MIARMLGLTVISELSSSADFELVTRLEKLIIANENNLSSTVPVDNAFSDLASTFRHGLVEVAPPGKRRPDADVDDDNYDDVPDSSRSCEGHRSRSRSRSLSPMRKRDPNIY